MKRHGALTLALPIKPGQKDNLVAQCAVFERENTLALEKVTGLHFARFVVLDAGTDAGGKPYAEHLIFSSNYDLPRDGHLKELIEHSGSALWELLSFCEEAPQGVFNADRLFDFLQSHNYEASTFYVGVGLRSVAQIRNENLLRHEIVRFIDANRKELETRDAKSIRKSIVQHIQAQPRFEWARKKAKGRTLGENIVFYGRFVIALPFVLVLLPIIIPFLIIWILLLWIQELRDIDGAGEVDREHIRTLVDRETQLVQAQFSAAGNVKLGFIRRNTMRFLLWLTNQLAPLIFAKGKLSGIPTVHFARWLLIHDKKFMVFLSNYDGNSETYLRDFINIAAKQLTLLFTHTIGYPKTRLLIFGGARDANGFMDWARKNQVVTNIWYNANPDVSIKNIWNNGEVRAGLYGSMNENQARKWLDKI